MGSPSFIFCIGDPNPPVLFSVGIDRYSPFYSPPPACFLDGLTPRYSLGERYGLRIIPARTASSSCRTTSPAPPPSAQSYTPADLRAFPCRGGRRGWVPIPLRKAQWVGPAETGGCWVFWRVQFDLCVGCSGHLFCCISF